MEIWGEREGEEQEERSHQELLQSQTENLHSPPCATRQLSVLPCRGAEGTSSLSAKTLYKALTSHPAALFQLGQSQARQKTNTS